MPQKNINIRVLPRNGLLLQMYGKCLAMDGKYEEAKDVLEKVTKLRTDPIPYTTLGDSYKALKEYLLAESAYEHAWQMVPQKFYPKFLLVKLYEDSGQPSKAKQVAKELLSKEIKVSSSAIIEMKEESKRLLQKLVNIFINLTFIEMRKNVLRIVAGATLMMAMAIGFQMNNVQQSESTLMMENLEAIAMAYTEGYPSDCEAVWDNVTCRSGGITYAYAKKI